MFPVCSVRQVGRASAPCQLPDQASWKSPVPSRTSPASKPSRPTSCSCSSARHHIPTQAGWPLARCEAPKAQPKRPAWTASVSVASECKVPSIWQVGQGPRLAPLARQLHPSSNLHLSASGSCWAARQCANMARGRQRRRLSSSSCSLRRDERRTQQVSTHHQLALLLHAAMHCARIPLSSSTQLQHTQTQCSYITPTHRPGTPHRHPPPSPAPPPPHSSRPAQCVVQDANG